VLFVGCVLAVPAPLLLLDEAAERLLVPGRNTLLHRAPDLQVLGGIASFILGGPLPGDDKGAKGREAELIDVGDGEVQDLMAGGGVDNGHRLGRGPAEEAAAGRVCTAPQVSLGLGDRSEGSVDRSGVEDASGLLGPVSEL